MADSDRGVTEHGVGLKRPRLLDGEERLRLFGNGLWYLERTLSLGPGARLPARMLVVQLADGGLFVWSPLALSPGLREALGGLGPVRFVVAPNTFHHLFLADYAGGYPDAELWAAAGLAEKRSDLPLTGELGARPAEGWVGELDQQQIGPLGRFCEVAFLHRASRSLLLADLAFNLRGLSRARDRLLWRVVTGTYGRFGPSRFARRSLGRDRAHVRDSLTRIAAWDFEHIVVAHGVPIKGGGREVFRAAFERWL
ncbi:MAG: DUF4336 domain-containing protein [Myxococcota bacterium]